MAKRPFVTANFALTWDGRISTRARTPADFSSPRDKRRLLEIRSRADAVLVTATTLAADRMTLGLPAEDLRAARLRRGQPPFPLRVVITNSGRLDPQLPVFARDFSPIIIFSTTRLPAATRHALAPRADLWLHESRAVNLPAMLQTLRAEYGVRRLVCEGGAQLFRSLLDAGLVDELHVTLCPRLFGGRGAPTLTGVAGAFLARARPLAWRAMRVVAGECFLRFRVDPA